MSKAFGILLVLAAVVGGAVSVMGLVDPVGLQHANDSNPFGTPPTTREFWIHLAFWIVLLTTGLWLFFRKARQ